MITRRTYCPACKRRGTLREYQGVMDTFERYDVATWQCVECGAVVEPKLRGLAVLSVERIVLRPGELQEMRDGRRQCAPSAAWTPSRTA